MKKVLVLDFGSQYTQLIARRIRELGVYSEIMPCTTSPSDIPEEDVLALILSGGPASVRDEDAPDFDNNWLKRNYPTLGICYGMQLLSNLHQGELSSGERREYGNAVIEVKDNSSLFANFLPEEHVTVWMSHGDHVEKIPQGFKLLASTNSVPVAAIGCEEKKLYGVQFHPEVAHSPRGSEILSAFIFKIAGLQQNWSADDFVERSVKEISEQVEEGANVICGLSGGVDSSVAAVLVDKAIGERLHCIFVDNGLVRKGEPEKVEQMLGKKGLGLNLKIVDAADDFLNELEGVTDPEKKRKIIGRVFIEVFEREAKKIHNATHLVQGTLYPDVIESISVKGPSATIKSHHNVGGLPERMNLKLLEPFRELFKDEVRNIGRTMKIPAHIVNRQPFPGPGLGVRIPGAITRGKIEVLKEADAIFLEEVRGAGLYESLWQTFCVFLPVQSVGVMGDCRTYENAIALRAVQSEDGMTADWAYLPEPLLRRVSNRIINEVKGINRVVLDISSKPPATIEWE